jgi:DNA-binding NarL/FixJ family response regulator
MRTAIQPLRKTTNVHPRDVPIELEALFSKQSTRVSKRMASGPHNGIPDIVTAYHGVPMASHNIVVLVAEASQMSSQLMYDAFLGKERRMQVEVVTADSTSVVKLLEKKRPQVAVVSARLQDGPVAGVKVLRELRAAQHSVPTVLLIDSEDRELIVESFRAGARGVFCRSKPFEALCKCIQVVSQGQIWADTNELQYVLEALGQTSHPLVANKLGSATLTKREKEVVALVAQGLTNREIGQELGLSTYTVRNYLFRIYDKVGVSNRVLLVAYYNDRALGSNAQTDRPDTSPAG